MILLPGFEKQTKLFLDKYNIENSSVLVIGEGSENIALKFSSFAGAKVELIVEDFESMINSKGLLAGNAVEVKMMEYEITDYENEVFDFVFAQASISGNNRNKIIKEIKRILKPGGVLAVGEIVKTENELPVFIQNILEESDMAPLLGSAISNYYAERKFEIVELKEFPEAMKEYYKAVKEEFSAARKDLNDAEEQYFKKLLKKISHETNSFIKHGGDKYLSFEILLLKKI